ncbi:hypothetical protein DER46DRAFT_574071 [Fusarium sp. MPI-SDFR-AT-0072]|nr:hypothetical protein DER46DRAFT_574071 [Fusarium sp. MPI-SDFR-AT-0072]
MTIDIKRLAWQVQHHPQGRQAIGTRFWDLERAIEVFTWVITLVILISSRPELKGCPASVSETDPNLSSINDSLVSPPSAKILDFGGSIPWNIRYLGGRTFLAAFLFAFLLPEIGS